MDKQVHFKLDEQLYDKILKLAEGSSRSLQECISESIFEYVVTKAGRPAPASAFTFIGVSPENWSRFLVSIEGRDARQGGTGSWHESSTRRSRSS